MAENIISRAKIAEQAEAAARLAARGETVFCPYQHGTDAHAAWQATFTRYLHEAQTEECEASA